MNLMAEIQRVIAQAKKIDILAPSAETADAALNRLAQTALQLGADAASEKVMAAFAFAHPFLDVCGDVVLSWMLLWRAVVAYGKLQEKGGQKRPRLL